jgi:hypothetical protein
MYLEKVRSRIFFISFCYNVVFVNVVRKNNNGEDNVFVM